MMLAGAAPQVSVRLNRKYPHLLPEEAEVWTRFLVGDPDYFELVQYDVHVGKGAEVDEGWSEEMKRMAAAITRKRIDVVGERLGETWLVDVKDRAGLAAIGSMLGYEALWRADNPERAKPRLCVICARTDRDTEEVARAMDVRLIVVGELARLAE